MLRVCSLCTGKTVFSNAAVSVPRISTIGCISWGIRWAERVRCSWDRSTRLVDEFAGQDFDDVLTVCDNVKESCPVFFGNATRLDHSFSDSAAVEGSEEKRLGEFRRVRNELRSYQNSFAKL